LIRVRGIANAPPKRLEGKKFFKFYGYSHFQVDCPNRRTLTIKEVEKIQSIEEDESEEEYKENDHTLVTLDIRKLLVI